MLVSSSRRASGCLQVLTALASAFLRLGEEHLRIDLPWDPDTDEGRGLPCPCINDGDLPASKVIYTANFGYPLSVIFIKVALLFQYLRIFQVGSKRRLTCKVLIGIVSIWGLIFCLFRWIPCIPLAAYWDMKLTDAKCWGYGSRNWNEFGTIFVSQAVSTCLLDFIDFFLPVRLYFTPGTQKETRVALLCLFAMGLA